MIVANSLSGILLVAAAGSPAPAKKYQLLFEEPN
jgi:hypothetical protein